MITISLKLHSEILYQADVKNFENVNTYNFQLLKFDSFLHIITYII